MKTKLYLWAVFALFSHFSFAQVPDYNIIPELTSGAACEGKQYVIQAVEPAGCLTSDYSGIPYYEFSYSVLGGTATLLDGFTNQINSNNYITLEFSPSSYFTALQCDITINCYRAPANGGEPTFCTATNLTIYAKKNFEITGPSQINDPGQQVYAATSVPGVTNYSWTIPSGWTLNSGNGTNSIHLTPAANDGSITVTTSPALATCHYPATKSIDVTDCFTHGETNYTFCTPSTWNTGLLTTQYFMDPDKFPRFTGDFNGDGKTDVVGFGNTAVVVGLSDGSSFGNASWSTGFTYGGSNSTQTKYPREVGDFNGDGKDDIIGFGQDYTYVGISTGSSFSTSPFTPSTSFTYASGFTDNNWLQRLIGDVTGDGKDDVIGFAYNGTAVGVSTGTSFSVSDWSGGASFSAGTGGMSDYNKWPKLLGDVTGDGKDDVIAFGNDNIVVGVSTDSSFNTSNWSTGGSLCYSQAWEQKKYPRMLGDFDGNGKMDIIGFGDDDIVVGISNGSSFTISSWLFDKQFVYANGWRVDGRPVGFGTHGVYPGEDAIRIADMNNDGKDDIVAFGITGTYVAYSTGSYFKCPVLWQGWETRVVGGMIQPTYNFEIGNFDNTDDEPEIAAFGYSNVDVMNCSNCTTSVAGAVPMDYNFVTHEASSMGTQSVYNYCAVSDVKADLSTTTCEDRYYVKIEKWNLSTWTAIGAALYDGWTINNAPAELLISSFATLNPGDLYLISYAVGPTWSSTNFLVRVATSPTAKLTDIITTPRLQTLTAGGNYPVYPSCTDAVSLTFDGIPSTCYTQYKYEFIEVNPTTQATVGSPIAQIPSGGGWATGPISSPTSISNSLLVSGKVYRLTLTIKNAASITSSIVRYYEKKGLCQPKGKSLEIAGTVSAIFPNPGGDSEIFLEVGDYGDGDVSATVYSMTGQVIRTIKVTSNSQEKINIDDLKPGTYIIRLESQDKTENLKFIRE